MHPLRVLVVEDEPVNRALVRAVLRSSVSSELGSVDVTEADTLAAAREAIARAAHDVVILDVRLPDGSGLDLLAELPPAGSRERPHVIVMSASVLPADREAAVRSGGDAFLGKPFQPADLVTRLRDFDLRARADGAGRN